MPLYAYRGLSTGKSVTGEIAAENERHARTLLRESGVVPVSLSERSESKRGTLSLAWMASFARQLGTLLRAGFPMDKALSSMAVSSADENMRMVLTAIAEGVSRGLKLSEAVDRAGGHSPAIAELTSMVEAGEASGNLAESLHSYAALLDRRLVFRRRLRGALFYPLIVASIAVIVVVFLFVYVVPTITKLFEGTDMVLPLPTRILFFVSHAFHAGALPALATIVIGAILFRGRLRSPETRMKLERILYHLPMIGRILEKAAVSRWARTFGVLLASGVDILAALEIAARTANSIKIRKAIETARPRVAQGVPLAKALAETKAFPPLAIESVSIGEASGSLAELLTEMAAGWEGEVEASAERFADFLEPIMLVVMGLIVGGIVLAILLPIFQFNAGVR